ncbi:MAG: KamA family radical SAM protein [Deltaproteobacteria bacterium]|nr:KamA family radical SAM protein [Deltaproteobacteria bacterium]
MDREGIRKKLFRILDTAPELKAIMLSAQPLEDKRRQIRNYLDDLIRSSFYDQPSIPSLEWVLTRDATDAFRAILSLRSEKIAGHSVLQYLDDLLHKDDLSDMEEPGSGFFAEMDHLIKGITGNTGIYPEKVPSFLRYQGVQAAKLRSADLSRMARTVERFMAPYISGLDKNVIRKRSINASRIIKYFNATKQDWEDWKWHVRHIIRDAKTLNALIKLTDEEFQAVTLARKYKIPFGITPYYLSLMDYWADREKDYAVRAQVIPSLHYVEKMRELRAHSEPSMDFMLERDTSPVEGITRRYPMIVILKPVLTCPQICVYCQRNWEIEDVYSPSAVLTKEKMDKALQWIAHTPEINEVLVTGGDPFLLSNKRMHDLLARLTRIKHLERIRIGTRTPVTLPQRITHELVHIISQYHVPGKREMIIVTHFEHPYEITPQSMEAVQKFRRCGMDVYNQLVYTFYNSKKFEAAYLRLKLRLIGVTPYYTFNTKGKEETDDFRVPIARLLQEQKEEARLLPGTVRTDEIVFNVPKLGKNYLRAGQHHDMISILPNGCRVYEFHPWEKKLSLMDTYVYTDVSIYDYLQRIKATGGNTAHYRSIWYYY